MKAIKKVSLTRTNVSKKENVKTLSLPPVDLDPGTGCRSTTLGQLQP